ncbi:AAA family ATPase [Zooshikella harenae]|uniref:AAA family ATPase n=1 Tax=Zooshikella harenae TaxID=2827238 RepID=A0ABS5ZBH8_9GAMM|nr:AAA family ATPase [Zooshikella harenae]MBU2711409.1 AAA family ATPase [Zooshikella harenae]
MHNDLTVPVHSLTNSSGAIDYSEFSKYSDYVQWLHVLLDKVKHAAQAVGVLGISGTGKTSLLAHLITELEKQRWLEKDIVVISANSYSCWQLQNKIQKSGGHYLNCCHTLDSLLLAPLPKVVSEGERIQLIYESILTSGKKTETQQLEWLSVLLRWVKQLSFADEELNQHIMLWLQTLTTQERAFILNVYASYQQLLRKKAYRIDVDDRLILLKKAYASSAISSRLLIIDDIHLAGPLQREMIKHLIQSASSVILSSAYSINHSDQQRLGVNLTENIVLSSQLRSSKLQVRSALRLGGLLNLGKPALRVVDLKGSGRRPWLYSVRNIVEEINLTHKLIKELLSSSEVNTLLIVSHQGWLLKKLNDYWSKYIQTLVVTESYHNYHEETQPKLLFSLTSNLAGLEADVIIVLGVQQFWKFRRPPEVRYKALCETVYQQKRFDLYSLMLKARHHIIFVCNHVKPLLELAVICEKKTIPN